MTVFWDRFLDIVRRFPNHIALQEGDRKVDYQTLYRNAQNLASSLKAQHSLEAEDLIALNMSKSIEYVTALLATWYAGCAFIPLPPCLPKERLKFIQNEANIKYSITQNDVQKRLQDCKQEILENPVPVKMDSLAYLIYTSGSTGTPKGVLLEHKGIVNFLDEQIEAFQFTENSRSLFYLSISFDASISDMGVALLSGATLIIEDDPVLKDGTLFLDALHRHNITHTDIPPSLLRIFKPEQMPESLETIIIGGEASNPAVIRNWASHLRVVNVYGPTETTVCTSLNICDPNTWEKPLIGIPFKNTDYRVLNAKAEPCPIGQAGELYIGGIQIARGYHNRPDLNAEKFITFNGQTFYKTGDKVVQHSQNEFEFIGRIDRQFKIRGQLVEPDEIETQLKLIPDIIKAAITKRSIVDGGQDCLIAFITAHQNIDTDLLKQQLSDKLPHWMIPQHIEQLDAMPLTATGKIDAAILMKSPLHHTMSPEVVDPGTEQQQQIFDLFAEILKHDQFGITDSFFKIGGDSLKVIDLTLTAQQQGLDITPALLVKHPTVAELDAFLNNEKAGHKNAKSGALSTTFLKRDVAFDGTFNALFDQAKDLPKATADQAIFLTGATGFLGSWMLGQLLSKTDQQIICLVRAKNDTEALTRITETLKKYHVPFDGTDLSRIKTVCGDLSKKHFNLTEDSWLNLTQQVGKIYHCAAWVNMIHSYQTMREANVRSCFEIVRFACTSVQKHLHYASTLSVFVATDQNTGTLYESDRLENVHTVYGGYAQTKWAAEYMMLQIPENVCPITHYRFGLITGDTQHGYCADADFLTLFSKGLKKLGMVPNALKDHLYIDISPIDYVAEAMMFLSQQNADEIYHIANPKSVSLGQWIDAMRYKGIDIRPVSDKEWSEIGKCKDLSLEERSAYLALCRGFNSAEKFDNWRTMDLFQATDVSFDTKNTDAVLLPLDIKCPIADQDLLKTYLTHIFKAY